MEFKEFSNPEEQDYDINSSLKENNITENNINDDQIDANIPDDIPEDNAEDIINESLNKTNESSLYYTYNEINENRQR